MGTAPAYRRCSDLESRNLAMLRILAPEVYVQRT